MRKHRKHKQKFLFLLSIVALISVTLIYTTSAKEITLTEIDEFQGINESKKIKTRATSVDELFDKHNVEIGDTDKISVNTDYEINHKDDIVIKRGRQLTIKIGDRIEFVTVTTPDEYEALAEAGYNLSEDDEFVANDSTIELYQITYDDDSITEVYKNNIEYVDDNTIHNGQEKVLEEGSDGSLQFDYRIKYVNGEEVEREVVRETITVAPVNKVVARGTKPTPTPKTATASASTSTAVDSGGTINGHKYKKKLSMKAYAYSTSPSENGGYTVSAMGNPLKKGVIAVDPKVIPLGSKVYVVGADGSWEYGCASAEDTGGNIKGNIIDLCFDTVNVNSFGKRDCTVYILE